MITNLYKNQESIAKSIQNPCALVYRWVITTNFETIFCIIPNWSFSLLVESNGVQAKSFSTLPSQSVDAYVGWLGLSWYLLISWLMESFIFRKLISILVLWSHIFS